MLLRRCFLERASKLSHSRKQFSASSSSSSSSQLRKRNNASSSSKAEAESKAGGDERGLLAKAKDQATAATSAALVFYCLESYDVVPDENKIFHPITKKLQGMFPKFTYKENEVPTQASEKFPQSETEGCNE